MSKKLKGVLAIALLHEPVYNRKGQVSVSALTNFDIHDIARASRTYGVETFFIVHPQLEQRKLALAVKGHWEEGFGASYNPKRGQALEKVEVVDVLEKALEQLQTRHPGRLVRLAVTKARPAEGDTPWDEVQASLAETDAVWLVCFGTSWGLTDEFLARCDVRIAPIRPHAPWRHLSVRSAVAITLERLVGEAQFADEN